MKAGIKKRWLKALRSDEYAQGREALVAPMGDYDAFCCLGVLCDVLREKFEEDQFGHLGVAVNGRGVNTDRLPFRLLNQILMGDGEQQSLIDMNDSGKSFKQIAQYIEARF